MATVYLAVWIHCIHIHTKVILCNFKLVNMYLAMWIHCIHVQHDYIIFGVGLQTMTLHMISRMGQSTLQKTQTQALIVINKYVIFVIKFII